ncbi:MAG: WecB/TagA/CpsF family glycosyltransferase [Leptolyngbyaceae cyanobacterium CSU_1_3]|nr:WecB/TagA/CpsF family glycosyltransferase [Leptolyngbyaceae cyanobacterium CSU_1_3]
MKAVEVLGTRIDCTSYAEACDRIQRWATQKTSCYVVAANVHVVMTAYWRKPYQQVLKSAALVTPDGMPLVWALRLLKDPTQTRVYGPDLMLSWCDRAAQSGLSIYLYGGTEAILEKLHHNLQQRFPNLTIAGSYAPPFRDLTAAEEARDCDRIHASGASVVFVALGCPKQEEWMARQQGKLQAVAIGVGAAFSFHSGQVPQAPRWLMHLGLEWLCRFAAEPRRLWKRYLFNNPAFVLLFGWQLVKHYSQQIGIARTG